jgi:hypothetical protein
MSPRLSSAGTYADHLVRDPPILQGRDTRAGSTRRTRERVSYPATACYESPWYSPASSPDEACVSLQFLSPWASCSLEHLNLDHRRTSGVALKVYNVVQTVTGSLGLIGGLLYLPSMLGQLVFVVGKDLFL